MNWISFAWGIGAIIFVNIVYAIWLYPKTGKQLAELEKECSYLERTLESVISQHEEMKVSVDKERNKLRLEVETIRASITLRKSCPACGEEFPLYILEDKVNG